MTKFKEELLSSIDGAILHKLELLSEIELNNAVEDPSMDIEFRNAARIYRFLRREECLK